MGARITGRTSSRTPDGIGPGSETSRDFWSFSAWTATRQHSISPRAARSWIVSRTSPAAGGRSANGWAIGGANITNPRFLSAAVGS